jgi:hypothetical protein
MRRTRITALLMLVCVAVLAAATEGHAQNVNVRCDTATFSDVCDHWYTTPWVSLNWLPDPQGMPLDGCNNQVVRADSPIRRMSCTVQWPGTTERKEVWIGIDQTPPVVSAAPARPPDYNGWFNHPVNVSFTGADATSGVDSCTGTGYGGPDATGVVLGGTCRDVAGNVAAGSYGLNYDSTPPARPDVTATPNDNQVKLRWAAPADAETIEVARITGTGLPALLFRGAATSFTDRGLKNGKRRRYLVTSIDRAGNRAVDRAHAVPTSSPLLSPAKGARLEKPPLLDWERVKRATYYNVQLYRGHKKVLTRWPRSSELQLPEKWRFAGVRRRFGPGSFTWFVFPAFGERSDRRFGELLGKSTFRVVD